MRFHEVLFSSSVSAFYLKNKKVLFLKNYLLGCCQYQDKKAFLLTQFSVKVLIYSMNVIGRKVYGYSKILIRSSMPLHCFSLNNYSGSM